MGAVQVLQITGAMQKQQLTGPVNMTVRRGGWLYVYVSNESNQDVYFDDLIINHKRGPVVETNSYYAFGMEIPGLAAKAIGFAGNPGNRIKYNGKELQSKEFTDGSGLEWEDYGARMYDAQIGRWTGSDPLIENSMQLSGYVYASNNPINRFDPDGQKDKPFNSKTDQSIYQEPGTAMPVFIYGADGKTIIGLDPSRQIAYNCHSYAWEDMKGDPEDPANAYLLSINVTK